MEWRSNNPARLTGTFKEGADGIHTWTEAEIDQYRAAYPLGTMARLALELTLNTAARRCNVAHLTRDDIVNGRIITEHAKGNNESSAPMLDTTRAALEALPAAPIRHLITTGHKKAATFQKYRAKADRVRLADSAFEKFTSEFDENE